MGKRLFSLSVALAVCVGVHACTIRDITEVPVGSVEVLPPLVTLLEGETLRLSAQAKDGQGNALPSGAVSWSSDASDVFLIDDVGEGEALVVGQTTVWATLDGVQGSAKVSVEPGPRISPSETLLIFLVNIGGGAPDPITLEITNAGGGLLKGVSASIEYPPGERAGWLSVALAGTSAPSSLTVSIPGGLSEEGVYDATLVLASPDARNSPVSVSVRAVATQNEPIIGLSSLALEFQADAPGPPPTPKTVRVTNLGGGVLGDLQTSSLYAGVGGWLSAHLVGSTAPADLVIRPDPSGLSPGTYTAEVRVSGPGALNSPKSVELTFTVNVGPANPETSTASVPGGTAGLVSTIVVQTRDGVGNVVSTGGAAVRVTVSGANNPGPLSVIDPGNGAYTASYRPTSSGVDRVVITMDGTPIDGSPFVSLVGAGAVSPENTIATVPDGKVGEPTFIVVEARDAYGNPLGVGGETVVVEVSGENPTGPFTATDLGDGTYTASYKPTKPGVDRVAITVDGTPISGSPLASTVVFGAVSPAHSTVVVPAGTAGFPTNIVVQARDAYGNTVGSGGAEVEVIVSGANDLGSIPVTDLGDGTYSAGYTPTTAGTDRVAITLDGTPVGDSPFASLVGADVVAPSHSTASVPVGTAGVPTNIPVQARDAYGNPVGSGGAKVEVTVSGANDPGSIPVIDLGDGTYAATYTPTVSGGDDVAITMDGTPIDGSPFVSLVGAGAVSPEETIATVPDGEVGEPTIIVVEARDAYGNPLSVGGETVVVEVSGENPTGPFTATDLGDGTYTATYTPLNNGYDFVAITINDEPLVRSPFKIKVDR